ncbi:glycosyltransferase [Clostridium perfringens]|uniref:glycosyltransferase family 2 protein n=1 Tax=Clostridium perfringens TaxID=1502 RepID=UPI002A53A350|nr:glycosyltransferase [Clostridium perfringens]MDK0806253.1 glycosyltransferase [Clostridium perfringens]MDK0829343.1 glycosyltransferase [Clostridium perfringens]MDM0821861.1 glycosyltransferase [Clostridium perfringens]MDM0824808.1 glycosyltransferase [Clostridium perfringens]
MRPKISIIVPVYKVENYIHTCVDSILNQRFKDFELILVDDGSPDKCGEICDEYAKKDNRIIVIHKENGGQATARNAALDVASGEYIGFVDSDDYIEPDMYEILYKICVENECDISNCSSIIHFNKKIVVNGGHNIITHNREEAMKVLMEGFLYDECLWTKLIKRELFEGLRIPTGIAYEDTAFTYKLFDKANKICCIGEAKYNYIKRENSTMDIATKEIKIDAIKIYSEMYSLIEARYPELLGLVTLKLANNSLVILNNIIDSNEFDKNKFKYYKTAKFLNGYFEETIKLKEYPKNLKILLVALKINPIIYKYLIKIIKLRR